jgi:hypothetical protein
MEFTMRRKYKTHSAILPREHRAKELRNDTMCEHLMAFNTVTPPTIKCNSVKVRPPAVSLAVPLALWRSKRTG